MTLLKINKLTVYAGRSVNASVVASLINAFFNWCGVNFLGGKGAIGFSNTTSRNAGEGRYKEMKAGRARCTMAYRDEGEADFKGTESIFCEWRDTRSSAELKMGLNSLDG